MTGNTLGLSKSNFIIIDSVLISFTDRIALLPVSVLASTIAPLGLEGFSFAALISIYDIGAIVSAGITAALVRSIAHHSMYSGNLNLRSLIVSFVLTSFRRHFLE